jgi:hypothetical protein
MEKLNFLINTFPDLLRKTPDDAPSVFGKMNLVQMIEHMSDSVRIANGKDEHQAIVTPEERIRPMQDFIRSEKDFKPNTKNILLGEEPVPARSANKEEAIRELEMELSDFVKHFHEQEGKTQRNPFFGDLDFNLWVQLLYKHAIHHLRQFNVEIPGLSTVK